MENNPKERQTQEEQCAAFHYYGYIPTNSEAIHKTCVWDLNELLALRNDIIIINCSSSST
jgi:hypothetical protein